MDIFKRWKKILKQTEQAQCDTAYFAEVKQHLQRKIILDDSTCLSVM